MQPKVIWYTGLPCSGKTTNAKLLVKRLREEKSLPIVLLDGDEIRDLMITGIEGFTKEDRRRHLDRIGNLSLLLLKQGLWVVCSFVSPEKEQRQKIRKVIENHTKGGFIEVYMKTTWQNCASRDTKGMWKKAINGEIKEFTGYSAPYDAPEKPEITIDPMLLLEENVQKVFARVTQNG